MGTYRENDGMGVSALWDWKRMENPIRDAIRPLQVWPFISYDWLFQWGYTCYKWAYFSTNITGILGHNCKIYREP